MELNLRNVIVITLLGLYISWGYLLSLHLGNYLEEYYKQGKIGEEFFIYIILVMVIYVAIAFLICFKYIKFD